MPPGYPGLAQACDIHTYVVELNIRSTQVISAKTKWTSQVFHFHFIFKAHIFIIAVTFWGGKPKRGIMWAFSVVAESAGAVGRITEWLLKGGRGRGERNGGGEEEEEERESPSGGRLPHTIQTQSNTYTHTCTRTHIYSNMHRKHFVLEPYSDYVSTLYCLLKLKCKQHRFSKIINSVLLSPATVPARLTWLCISAVIVKKAATKTRFYEESCQLSDTLIITSKRLTMTWRSSDSAIPSATRPSSNPCAWQQAPVFSLLALRVGSQAGDVSEKEVMQYIIPD